MPCVCDGGICVATSCRDVTCHVYVMVVIYVMYCRDITCHVYVIVVSVMLYIIEM